MVESRYTHVSIVADDLEESVDFYESVFGMKRIPTPAFDERIQWLQCGEFQLHLVERDDDPPAFNHHALHVDDFEAVYQSIREHARRRKHFRRSRPARTPIRRSTSSPRGRSSGTFAIRPETWSRSTRPTPTPSTSRSCATW